MKFFISFLIFSEIKKRIKKLIKVSKIIDEDNLLKIKKMLLFIENKNIKRNINRHFFREKNA